MRTLIFMAVAIAMLGYGWRAGAAVFTFDYSLEYTGGQSPAGAAPWLRATFDDEGTAGSVRLTFEALNLTGTEFVSRAFFNLDPALNPNDLVFGAAATTSGSFAMPSFQTGTDAFIGGGGLRFDVLMNFAVAPPAQRFTAGDSASFMITGIPTLTANSFDFLSVGGGPGPLPTSAQVQGIGVTGDDSGWVSIPEPGVLGLLTLCGVALLRRRI